MTRKKVVGLLVVYYEDYFTSAVTRFESLLTQLSNDYLLILISNNSVLNSSSCSDHRLRLEGDNALREFSAWDKGLAYCRDHQLLADDGLLVLANDTFCHHNHFGLITRRAFTSAFRDLLRKSNEPIIAGEVHSFGHDFQILGKSSSSWVSTYLFGMTAELFRRLGRLTPETDMDSFFTGQSEDDFISGPISKHLAKHIQSWLFSPERKNSWYRAGHLNYSNRNSYIGKAKSILCEKFLSAEVISIGGHIRSVFSNPIVRKARKLEKLLPEFWKKIIKLRGNI